MQRPGQERGGQPREHAVHGEHQEVSGERRTELVFDLRELTIRGLCLSNRVRTPVGTYTLRVTAPRLTAERLSFGLDSIDSIVLLGQQLNVGSVLNLLPVNNAPLGTADEPGALSLRVGAALVAVSITLRYLTGSNFNLGDVRMASGRAKRECF